MAKLNHVPELLANSDRWADDSVFSRDLIDLAMMQPKALVWQRVRALAPP